MKFSIKQLFNNKPIQQKKIDAIPCGLKHTIIPKNYKNVQWDIDKAAEVKIYLIN